MMTISPSPVLAETGPVVVVDRYRGDRPPQRVRWCWTVTDAGMPGAAALIATARGVQVNGWLTDVPEGWVDAARRAHARLRDDPSVDLTGMATHRSAGAVGRVVPVGD